MFAMFSRMMGRKPNVAVVPGTEGLGPSAFYAEHSPIGSQDTGWWSLNYYLVAPTGIGGTPPDSGLRSLEGAYITAQAILLTGIGGNQPHANIRGQSLLTPEQLASALSNEL